MEEWKEYKIGDLGRIVTGKTPKTSIKENYGGNIPFLTPSDDLTNKYIPNTIKKITKLGLSEVKNCLLPPNSICVSCIGSDLGKVVMLKEQSVTNQQFNSIIPNEDFCPDFIYYLMTIIGKELNFIGKTSTAVPIVNKSSFSNTEVVLPSLLTQQKIANILSSLDDKIEVNRRINEQLEELAGALFKSWFVDFEPFKDGEFVDSELGMIPKGCTTISLSKMADYLNGLAMQKFRPLQGEKGLPVLKIKELGQDSCNDTSELCSPSLVDEKYIVNDGDVIFSWSGTLLVKLWCGGICGLNQHLFKVTSKKYPKWFIYLWTKHHLDRFIRIAKDKAVTMGHIKRGELDTSYAIVLDDERMKELDGLMSPIIEQIINNNVECRNLTTLRDTLLPKLMSGEIDVNEVEI